MREAGARSGLTSSMLAEELASFRARHTSLGMLLFTCEGPRSVDDRDVIAVYRDAAMGGYCQATVIVVGGKEISGRCLVAAVNHIESELADQLLPPEAA